MLDLGGDLAVMMYLSKGILCKGGSKSWLYIRHLGQPTVLNGEEAVLWQKSRFGFSYTTNQSEIAIVQKLTRKKRKVLEMLFVHCLEPEDVAKNLQCTLQHVYNMRSLALKELKEKMQNMEN